MSFHPRPLRKYSGLALSSESTHDKNTEPDAGPNDEERGPAAGPVCEPWARSSSSVSFPFGGNMTKLTPRTKRLLLIALLLACVVPFAPLANPQLRHLHQVRNHIARIDAEWETFKRENTNFEDVHLFAYTGGDGMFGANGYVRSDADLTKLRAFMEGTKPPRPVFLDSVRVLDVRDAFMKSAGPSGAANGSQPIRSETNRTSSAAGSRR
jgi:hypothetical protein